MKSLFYSLFVLSLMSFNGYTATNDIDDDGVLNAADLDSDNDGIVNVFEDPHPFDTRTAMYDGVFDIASKETIPQGLAFSNDGLKLFVTGTGTNNIHQYSLTTPFDITGGVNFEKSTIAGDLASDTYSEVSFNADGSKVYLVGFSTDTIYQHTLTTPFDIGNISTAVTHSITADEDLATGLRFNTTGTRVYVMGYASKAVIQYNLASAFDISSGVTLSGKSQVLSDAGSQLHGLAFNDDGTKLFVVSADTKMVTTYKLSSPFDVTASLTKINQFYIGDKDSSVAAIMFSADGGKFFITGSSDKVHQYTFRVAVDTDGIKNGFDLDSDNDGISDSYESGFVATETTRLKQIITDNDVNSPTTAQTTAVANAQAKLVKLSEIFADGTVTKTESSDYLSIGQASTVAGDADTDGLMDIFDKNTASSSVEDSILVIPVDSDNVQAADYIDLDSDEDGIADTIEARLSANFAFNDGDVSDDDADNDGIIGLFDDNDTGGASSVFGGTHANFSAPVDSDGDGIADFIDINSDNDGAFDYTENIITGVTNTLTYQDPDGAVNASTMLANVLKNEVGDTTELAYREGIDSDSDGKTDHADLDRDNDGILDKIETSLPYDFNSATYNGAFNIVNEESVVQGLVFSHDGLTLFIIGLAQNNIKQYSLTTPFDITSGVSFEKTMEGGQFIENGSSGLVFNTDGTKVFIVGYGQKQVSQYSLSTAFDVGDVTFEGKFSVSNEDGLPMGVRFNQDGTMMYIMGYSNSRIIQYSLSVAFDITSGVRLVGRSENLASDGTQLHDLVFNKEGTLLFTLSSLTDTINTYYLTTPFDITAPLTKVSAFSVDNIEASGNGIELSSDGNTFFVIGTDTDKVHQFTFGLINDGDSVALELDLDSDNDGISDSYESGFVATETARLKQIITDNDVDSPTTAQSEAVTNAQAKLVKLSEIFADGTITKTQASEYLSIGQASTISGDADNDGLMDIFDQNTTVSTALASIGVTPVDTDSDTILNFVDLDSDNDGIADTIEARPTASFAVNDGDVRNDDADGDGVIALFDTNDALGASSVFGATHANFSHPIDTDDDGNADYIDTDSDGDTTLDSAESIKSGVTNTLSYQDPDGAVDNSHALAAVLKNQTRDTTELAYREFPNRAPVATATSATTNEDIAKAITLSATDADSDSLTYSIVAQPSRGNVVISGSTATYTPSNNTYGSDNFTYKANDGLLDSTTVAVSVTVNSVNDAPTITGTPATSVNEDVAYSFTPTANDVDTGTTLIFGITNKPSWASFSTSTGKLSGTPSNSDVGTTSGVVISVSDGSLSTSLSAFNLEVVNVNDAPTITGTPATSVNEDVAYSFTPTANDVDTGTTLTFSIANKPSWASFSTSTGKLSGTPTNTNVGTTSGVVISVSDGSLSTSLSAFNLEVVNVNDAPTITGTPATSVNEDVAYSFTPTANDVDTGTTLIFSISNKPSWASFDTATGRLTGIPVNSDIGVYNNIEISVSDGMAEASLIAFTIEVLKENLIPVASNMTIDVTEDGSSSFLPEMNDEDVDDVLILILKSQPNHGELRASGNTLIYSPDTNYFGEDSFTFAASDSKTESTPATVSIRVRSVNDIPIANDDVITLTENEQYTYTLDVLANDSDIEDETPTLLGATTDIGHVTVVNGKLLLNTAASIHGHVNVQYVVNDSNGARNQAKAIIRFTDHIANTLIYEEPAAIVMNATGLLTKVSALPPIITDSNGNRLTVTLFNDSLFFKPGNSQLQWQVVDREGVTSIITQAVQIYPLIDIRQDEQVAGSQAHSLTVYLNGQSPQYPVTIPYDVTGSSDSGIHDLVSGELVIAGGIQGKISYNTFGNITADETLMVTLAENLNRGGNASTTVVIKAGAMAPKADITIMQDNEQRPFIDNSAGDVSVHVVQDENTQGNIMVSYSSDLPEGVALINTETGVSFSPEGIAAGIYTLTITLEGEDGQNTIKTVYLEILESLAELGTTDTDGDGLPDNIEGYGDNDGDGVPDYLDNENRCNVGPEQRQTTNAFLVEAEAGVCLRKTLFLTNQQSGGILLYEEEVPVDTGYTNISGLFGFVAYNLAQMGNTAHIVLPQTSPISSHAVYRKLINNIWGDFTQTDTDKIYSTMGERGYCPAPKSSAWTLGLQDGAWCVQLAITDGGVNDADGVANGAVVDPGGIAIEGENLESPALNDNQIIALAIDETVVIDVLNGIDDRESLSVVSASVDFGEVVIVDDKIAYAAPESFTGAATNTYGVMAENGITTNATLIINVLNNSAPVANIDKVSTNDKSSITIAVLGNDTDAEDDALTLISATVDNGQGQVIVNSDNTLTYTPAAGESGVATISYTIRDAKQSQSTGQVEVTVTAYETITITNTSSGGGSTGVVILTLLALLVLARRQHVRSVFAHAAWSIQSL